ncbi:hypothetical protein LY76DRAFT_589936 [Colletotrichum caudatum]|nr:hypothetical protein LY76DRAFT_589936 [Colletotrichum caudatum]
MYLFKHSSGVNLYPQNCPTWCACVPYLSFLSAATPSNGFLLSDPVPHQLMHPLALVGRLPGEMMVSWPQKVEGTPSYCRLPKKVGRRMEV